MEESLHAKANSIRSRGLVTDRHRHRAIAIAERRAVKPTVWAAVKVNSTVCPEKSEPQTFYTDKCKQVPYWTKFSLQSPRSIWVTVANFHTIPSYHLTDFHFLNKLLSQISVTDMTCLGLLRTRDARHLHHAWRHFVDKQNVVKRR